MKLEKNKSFRIVSGIFLIMLGILGGFLPVLPGFVFFISGLSLLSVSFAKDIKKSTLRYRCHKNIFKFIKEIVYHTISCVRESFLKMFSKKFKYL